MASFVTALTGTSQTVVLPEHQPGDLIIVNGIRNNGLFFYGLSGWGNLYIQGGSGIRQGCYWTLAGEEPVANPTLSANAQVTIAAVYRPSPGTILLPFDQSAYIRTDGTIVYYRLLITDDHFLIAFGNAISDVGTIETPPTGMTLRAHIEATSESALFDSNGMLSSWSDDTFNVGVFPTRSNVFAFKEMPLAGGGGFYNPFHCSTLG